MSKSQSWKSTNVKTGISYAERLRLANSNGLQQANGDGREQSEEYQPQFAKSHTVIPSSQSHHLNLSGNQVNLSKSTNITSNPKVSLPQTSSTSASKASTQLPSGSSATSTASASDAITGKATIISTSSSNSQTVPASVKPANNPWTERRREMEQKIQNRQQVEAAKQSVKGKERDLDSMTGEDGRKNTQKLTEYGALVDDAGSSNNWSDQYPSAKGSGSKNSKGKCWADVTSTHTKFSEVSAASASVPSVSATSHKSSVHQLQSPRPTTKKSSAQRKIEDPTPLSSIQAISNTAFDSRSDVRSGNCEPLSENAPEESTRSGSGNGDGGGGSSKTAARMRRRSKSGGSSGQSQGQIRLDSSDWPEVSGPLKDVSAKGSGKEKEKAMERKKGQGKQKEQEQETAPILSQAEADRTEESGTEANCNKVPDLEDQFKDLDVKLSGRERKDKNGKNWISIVPDISVRSDHKTSKSGNGNVTKDRRTTRTISNASDERGRKTRSPSVASNGKDALTSAGQAKLEQQEAEAGVPIEGSKGDELNSQALQVGSLPDAKATTASRSPNPSMYPQTDSSLEQQSILDPSLQENNGQLHYPPPQSGSPQAQLQPQSHLDSHPQSHMPRYSAAVSPFQSYPNLLPVHQFQTTGDIRLSPNQSCDPSIVASMPSDSYYRVSHDQFSIDGMLTRGGGPRRGRGRGRGGGSQSDHLNRDDYYTAMSPDSTTRPQIRPDRRLDDDYNSSHNIIPQPPHLTAMQSQIPMQARPAQGKYSPFFHPQSSHPNFHGGSQSSANPIAASPTHALLNQIEFYFSQRNLQGDFYLRNQMNQFGFVPISVVSNFNRVKKLTGDLGLIRDTLLYSQVLEVSHDGTMVRKKWGWEEFVMDDAVRAANKPENGSNHHSTQASHQNQTHHQMSMPESIPPPPRTLHPLAFHNQHPQLQHQIHDHLNMDHSSHHHLQGQQSHASSLTSPHTNSNEMSSATTPTTNEDNHSKTSTISSPPSTFSLGRRSDEDDLILDDANDEELLESKDDDETLGVVAAEGLGGLVG